MKSGVLAIFGVLVAPALFGQPSDRSESEDAFRRAAERDLRVRTLASEYASADVVALVRIQSGQIVEWQGKLCGVEVSAQVVEAFKGVYAEGDRLRLARGFFMGVGSHYLLFLSEGDDGEVGDLQTLLGIAPTPECERVLPQLVPVGAGIVRGNDSLSINAIPKYLYFEGSWTFPPDIESPMVRFETNLGVMPKRQVGTESVLAELRVIARDSSEE